MKNRILRITEVFLCMGLLLGLAGCSNNSGVEDKSAALADNNADLEGTAVTTGENSSQTGGGKREVSVISYEEILQNRDSLYFTGMGFDTDGEGNIFEIWLLPNEEDIVVAVGKNAAHVGNFYAEDYWGYSLEDAFAKAYENLSQNGDILEKQEKLVCHITAMSFDREDGFKEIFQRAAQKINPSAQIEYCIDSEMELAAANFGLEDAYVCRKVDEESRNDASSSDAEKADKKVSDKETSDEGTSDKKTSDENNQADGKGCPEDFETMMLLKNTILNAEEIDLSKPQIIDLNGYTLKLTGTLQFDSNLCRKYDGVLEENLGDGRYSGIFRVQDSSTNASGKLDVSELHFAMADQEKIDEEDADIDFHTCVALFKVGWKNITGIDKEHNETDPYFDLHVDNSGEFMNLIYFHEGYETRTNYWNENIYDAMNNNISVEEYNESLCMHDAEIELDFDKLKLDCENPDFGGPMEYFIYVGKGTTLKLTGTYDYRNVALKLKYLDRFGDGPVVIDATDLKFELHEEYKQPEIIKVDEWTCDAVQENVTFIYPEAVTNSSASNLTSGDGKISYRTVWN